MNLSINYALIDMAAKPPERATYGSSGFDLRCINEWTVAPSEVVMVRTGVVIELPEGHEGQLRSRSGIAGKGIILLNGIGTIDSDYRGELMFKFKNISDKTHSFNKGDRIGQLIIMEVPRFILKEVKFADIEDTIRGAGGFGSTGLQ